MVCKTYELKVDKSHLSKETLDTLRRLFLEAKWFYNNMIAKGEVFHFDYKSKIVEVRNKDGKLETRVILCLSSQMRQEIVERAKNAIRGLAHLKKKGYKVGPLKFKSRIGSIPLRQYGRTHRISDDRVVIQNVKQRMRIRGLNQIPDGAELANATLQQRYDNYFIHITTFQTPIERPSPGKAIGVDAGIRHQLTLSNGLQLDESIPMTKKLKHLHKELSKRTLHGKNWFKTSAKLNKEYGRQTNQRTDIRHKVVSELVSRYDSVAVQDDNIAGWQRMWGRRVATSAIGGIMRDLKTKSHTPVVIGRFEPTSRKCSNCGATKEVSLEERSFLCDSCGLHIDRDLNAAINVWRAIPAERREFTPVDMKAATEILGYFNGIPSVSASLVEEAGSRSLATRPGFGSW